MAVIDDDRMDGPVDAAGGGGGRGKEEEKILVSVRLRPLNEKEIARNDTSDWECINDTTIIFRNSMPERSMIPTAYTFDRVFRSECTTKQVYEEGAKEVALSVVSGINASIFAYGQTSSGKTYTMNGITEYTVTDIYEYIKRHEERAFVLKFSAMEIYNEAVRDLLSMDNTPLRVLDDPERGTIVERLTEQTLRDWSHLRQLISVCEAQRQIGETLLNEMSSRSHQILRLTVESSACELLGQNKSSTLVASVNFVDLAGSERASLALSSGTRLKEGCHINRSLLTLGTVIRKLSKGRNGHIPYRDSKLTRILHPSLGGNSRTAIICTICPARSHIEQSRNTLLFASCAKEVVTSARVNVVMSDKALVKHLQKELARLESELRYPGSASIGHLELLLREKDAQIRKMEKEMKELTQERDLAQSRLEDLLQLIGEDRTSRQWEEASQNSASNVPHAHKTVPSSKSSNVSNHIVDFGSTKFRTSLGSNNHMGHYLQHSEKPKLQDVTSPSHSISSSMFYGLASYQGDEEIVQDTHEDFEDHCKEVQCIEVDKPIKGEDPNLFAPAAGDNLLHLAENPIGHEARLLTPTGEVNTGVPNANSTYITLEQHLQNVRKTLDSLGKPYPNEISPWSKNMMLSRSRSCRANLMHSSSLWLQEAEQNESTPPCSSLRDFPGRPYEPRRRCFALNFDAETEVPSVGGSDVSEQSTSRNLYKPPTFIAASKGDVTSISDFVTELKEMAQVHYQQQLTDGQVEPDATSVGLDPIIGPMESPSHWPLEFEKQQNEIIVLWQECNVSLVHRTYFFMLFKGDPTDSIYMEVELRRLLFLRRTLSSGDLGEAEGSKNAILIASLKNLRRERVMLCRQMQKRMSPEERESIYNKWGIALDSKQRRLQLARRLWTDTSDMEHVRESALTVAKIVGFLERGDALKEMFGLSFTPQHTNQASYSWKRGISSLK